MYLSCGEQLRIPTNNMPSQSQSHLQEEPSHPLVASEDLCLDDRDHLLIRRYFVVQALGTTATTAGTSSTAALTSTRQATRRQHWMGHDLHYARGIAEFIHARPTWLFGLVIWAVSAFIRHVRVVVGVGSVSPVPFSVHVAEDVEDAPRHCRADAHAQTVDTNTHTVDTDTTTTVIFSHGLAGTRFMYARFAEELVALLPAGSSVYAVEHQDGSACATTIGAKEERLIKLYQHPRTPGPNEETRHFRRLQLHHRTNEVMHIVRMLVARHPGRRILLAGHSFGAATMFGVLTRMDVPRQVRGALLVDPWWFATTPSDYIAAQQHTPWIPIYTATTERFHWPEQDHQSALVASTLGTQRWHERDCPETRHQDLSDICVYMPRLMRWTGGSGARGGLEHVRDVVLWFIKCAGSW